MAGENPASGAKALWHRQQEEPQDVAVASVRRRAAAIEADRAAAQPGVPAVDCEQRRDLRRAGVAPACRRGRLSQVFFLAVSLAQIEALTRSTPVTAPGDAGLMTSLAFLRASLERDRAFAARAWLWFLLPAGISELALVASMLGKPARRCWSVARPLCRSVVKHDSRPPRSSVTTAKKPAVDRRLQVDLVGYRRR